MRKLGFYPKLALGNLWRNRATYLPYLFACVVSIFTFYSMLAINLNGTLENLPQAGIVMSFTAIGTIILALFCVVLIFYTNSFLIKRRKKEIGLYSILGMEKKNIGIVMFFETLFIAMLALVLGLLSGLLLCRLLFLVLLRMVRYPVNVAMPVSPMAMLITVLFFGLVFLLTLLTNLRQVRIANPINLMRSEKEGEKEPRSSVLVTLIGLVTLGAGYFIALHFKSPIEALMLFLVAAALVIVGTFCLFTSGSIAVLKLLRKNKDYYYQKNHFIAVSGMIYRMKQNAVGLAAICVLSCMVLTTVSSTISLNVGTEDSLLTMYPTEYWMRMNEPTDGDQLLTGAVQVAENTGATIENFRDYRSFSATAEGEGGVYHSTDTVPVTGVLTTFAFVPLEDYNRVEGTDARLAPGQALVLCTGGVYSQNELTFNGIRYGLTPIESFGAQRWGEADVGPTILLVLPESEVHAAMAAMPGAAHESGQVALRRFISFDTAGTEAAKEEYLRQYNTFVNSIGTQQTFIFRARELNREDWYGSNGGFLFLGIYFGVLFMLAAALIIYYKQVSEGYDDAERFQIMQEVGMSEEEVRRAINAQIRTVFFLPLVVAVVHIAMAFWPVSRVMVIFSVNNQLLLALCTLATILAYALVYILVYRRTAKTYFKLVRRQTAP